MVLKPTVFSRMVQKRQLEEVQAAGIEDLENCPFCGFATIPHPDSTVFMCYNPECMRDSCRFDIIRTVFYSELNPHVHSNIVPLHITVFGKSETRYMYFWPNVNMIQ